MFHLKRLRNLKMSPTKKLLVGFVVAVAPFPGAIIVGGTIFYSGMKELGLTRSDKKDKLKNQGGV